MTKAQPDNTPAERPPDADAAPAQLTPADAIVKITKQYEPVIARLLVGSGMEIETFTAMLSTTLRNTPDLWATQPSTWLAAALRCAQLQMPPNDGTNRTWIIPRGGKAVFQLGYGGVMELARRAVPGIKFDGREVYPNDLFEIDYGTGHFRHVPYYSRRGKVKTDPGGAAYLWYVKVSYPDGRQHVHVLDRNKVEYHRSFSQRAGGRGIDMWKDSYNAAALKSVVVDMKRWLPASPTFQAAVAHDGGVLDVEQLTPAGELAPLDDEPKAIDVYQGDASDDEIAEGVIEPDEPLPPEPPADPADEAWIAEAKGGAK